MNCLVTFVAIASIAFTAPSFAQGRFGAEAQQRAADREYREAIRRAEHPELYEKAAAAKPAEAPAQETAAAPAQETAAAPAQPVEPSAAAPAPAAAH